MIGRTWTKASSGAGAALKRGQAAEQHRERCKQDTGSDSFAADEP
jgi:hypothetical protein